MGNQSCYPEQIIPTRTQGEHPREVIEILQDFPAAQRNLMFKGNTTRYSDLSVIHQDYNRYVFVLKIDGFHEVRVVLPVINDLPHRALTQNYKLTIGKDFIIDPFDQVLESCLFPVKNQATQKEYSMKIISFKGYNSIEFKRALQQVWIYKKIKESKQFGDDHDSIFLWLQDCFIYGINHDQQAVIMLYQRIQGSLTLGAEFRWKGSQAWRSCQKLKIYRDVLKACIGLENLKMVHRDLRASNLYYSEKRKKYLLRIACVRQIDYGKDKDLMTVIGIPTQAEGNIRNHLSNRTNIGIYRVRDMSNSQLRVLNRLLNTRRIADELSPSQFKQSIFRNIQNMLLDHENLSDILAAVERAYQSSDTITQFDQEGNICKALYRLYPFRIKKMGQEFVFNVYYALGYQKQFSDMAHQIIEKNNVQGKPFQNAKILKELGSFYDRHGTGGSQYLLNACALFCKEAESALQRGLYQEAQQYIEQGEEIYINLSSIGQFSITMLELKRLRAELRARTIWQVGQHHFDQQKKEVLQLMSKTLELAAQQSLPVEKQMKMFLTWGVVHRECRDRVAAQQRFRNGLAVCQNAGSFESNQAALLMKSHFLFEFASMKLDILQEQHDPLLTQQRQSYHPEDLPKLVQNWLQQSLQIRQKESTRLYQPIQCLMELGKLYMLESEYLQAQVFLKRAYYRIDDFEKDSKIKTDVKAEILYDLGSVNYKLQNYEDSVGSYREAIHLLQEKGGDPYWINVISGNLGLAQMRAGRSQQGKDLLQKSKQAIRAQNGAHHYDFLFLASQEQLIAHSIEV